MTCSTSCSSRRARAAALVAAFALVAVARGARAEQAPAPRAGGPARSAADLRPGAGARIAVLPLDNVSASSAPLRSLRAAIEVSVAQLGFEVVGSDGVERFLAEHRIRNTSGIDRVAAKAAGEELAVSAVLLASVESWADDPRPALSLSMRLVSADEEARILWFDAWGRVGDDSPGLLGLGVITSARKLQDTVLSHLGASLARALDGRGPRAAPCDDGGRFKPRVPYPKPAVEAGKTYSVAVVPFRNLTRRRAAGDVVALELARQWMASVRFDVLEPGIVREQLLRSRIVMEGGISLDQVRTILATLDVDLVIAGDVVEYTESGRGGAPNVNFTATMLDAKSGRIVWQSTSFNQGDDGVHWFDLGRVSTASVLTCRMLRTALDRMVAAPPEVAQPRPGDPARIRKPGINLESRN